MKNTGKKFAVFILVLVLAAAAIPLQAAAQGQSTKSIRQNASFADLTGNVQAEVKSVLCGGSAGGIRIAAVIRLKNTGTHITRVPDFELRAQTGNGILYTLQPSASNPKAIQAKEEVELSYMLTVDRTDSVKISHLVFVHVNDYVYPKQETTWLDVNVAGRVWQGTSTGDQDLNVVTWTDTFKVPGLESNIVFTPQNELMESTAQGPVMDVTLTAQNEGTLSTQVPNLEIGVRTSDKLYTGKSVEQGPIMLESKEKKNIHYTISLDRGVQPLHLLVMTPETFVQPGAGGTSNSQTYAVGKVEIELPQGHPIGERSAYKYGSPISLNTLDPLVDPKLQLSLAEFHITTDSETGLQTGIAKFEMVNKSDLPLSIPDYGVRLTSSSGYAYDGVRQNLAAASLLPNLHYDISYVFTLPASDKGTDYLMNILDANTKASYEASVADLALHVQQDNPAHLQDVIHLAPFDLKIKDMVIFPANKGGSLSGADEYCIQLDAALTRKTDSVVDADAPKLRFKVYNGLDQLLGTQTVPFTGEGKLISGDQKIFVNSNLDQSESVKSVKIYEVVNTPQGEAERYLMTYRG